MTRVVAVSLIHAYQRHVSPRKGFRCAHRVLRAGPSCSVFGERVIARYGVLKGAALLRLRFGACASAAAALADGAPPADGSDARKRDAACSLTDAFFDLYDIACCCAFLAE